MDITQRLDVADLYSAKDLVVVVSGGGSGLGTAFVSALTQTGAKRVYIAGRRLANLESAAKSIDPSGKVVVPVQCDVSDPQSVSALVKRVEQEVGYLDVLINNAGVIGPSHKTVHDAKSISELQGVLSSDWDAWPATFAINTTAVCGVSVAFLGLLEKGNERRGWASGKLTPDGDARARDLKAAAAGGVEEADTRTSQIITTSSIASFNRYITAGMAYSASKAGATMVGKTLATTLAPYGIRSNVICPGIYPSEMTANASNLPWTKIPAGRQGAFNEIVGALLYLVGKAGAYVNGACEITDGGRLSVMNATY